MGSLAATQQWAAGSWQKVLLHSAVGGASSALQGGKWESGVIGAGISQVFAQQIDALPTSYERIGASTFIGGVTAGIYGGDVYHGALSAGFGRAFNDEAHRIQAKALLKQAQSYVVKVPDPVYDVASIGLGLGVFAFEVGTPMGWALIGASVAVSGANTYKMYYNGATYPKIMLNIVTTASGPFISATWGFQVNKSMIFFNQFYK